MAHDEMAELALHAREHQASFDHTVRVCTAAGYVSSGSLQVKESLERELEAHDRSTCCRVLGVGCMGLCAGGPLVKVDPQDLLYRDVKPEDAPTLLASIGAQPAPLPRIATDHPFFARKQKHAPITSSATACSAPTSASRWNCGSVQAPSCATRKPR